MSNPAWKAEADTPLKDVFIADAVAANPEAGIELLAQKYDEDHILYQNVIAAFDSTEDMEWRPRLQKAATFLQESDSLHSRAFGRVLAWCEGNFRDP